MGLRSFLRSNMAVIITIVVVVAFLLIFILVMYFRMRPPSKHKNVLIRHETPFVSNSTLGVYDSYAVSTDASSNCSTMAKQILAQGGTAVDAAITALLCMGVTNPESNGIGGGVIMTIYHKSDNCYIVIDAREVAPSGASETMFNGSIILSLVGALAAAVPGELAGLEMAHKKYGSMPWPNLFAEPIRLCTEGFPVGSYLAKQLLEYRPQILKEPTLSEIFVDQATNDVYKEGDILTRPDLAKTYQQIADNGANIFYNGDLGVKFVQDVQEMGGIISLEDLQSYTARPLEPIYATLSGNLTLATTPPPGSGALFAYILNILDGFTYVSNDDATLEDRVLDYHRISEAFKFASAKKPELEGVMTSPDFQKMINDLISSAAANTARSGINDSHTFRDPRHYGLDVSDIIPPDYGTSHVSILAPNGDAVAATTSINHHFGCQRRSKATGIILNDQMADFNLPMITPYEVLPPLPYNEILPGQRPFSSMVPSIFVDGNGNVKLVIGGDGGTASITGTTLVAWNILKLCENVKEAIDAPRFFNQLIPPYLTCEERFSEAIAKGLEQKGHQVLWSDTAHASQIMAVERGSDGKIYANSDYRKDGTVDGG